MGLVLGSEPELESIVLPPLRASDDDDDDDGDVGGDASSAWRMRVYASVGTGTGLEPQAGRRLGLDVLVAWVPVVAVIAVIGQSWGQQLEVMID